MKRKDYIIKESQLVDLLTNDFIKKLIGIWGKSKDTNSSNKTTTDKSQEINPEFKPVQEPTNNKSKETPIKDVNLSANTPEFSDAINRIIDGLEGGYYHPNMKTRNPSKFAAMGKSGETMFGMDREHGKQENTAPGREFWRLIDNENASTNWGYNYKLDDNPGLANKLKSLIADIMKPLFEKFSNKYLTPESKQLVMSNPPLYFNFVYATWNGSGWFKKFAEKFNEEVKNGTTNPEELADIVVQYRRNSGNSILSKTSSKVDSIMSDMA